MFTITYTSLKYASRNIISTCMNPLYPIIRPEPTQTKAPAMSAADSVRSITEDFSYSEPIDTEMSKTHRTGEPKTDKSSYKSSYTQDYESDHSSSYTSYTSRTRSPRSPRSRSPDSRSVQGHLCI